MSSDTLMTDLTAAPTTDPSSIYRTRDELYADDMLIAALQGIDFFTWLDANPGSIDQIASALRVSRAPGGRDDNAVRRARPPGT